MQPDQEVMRLHFPAVPVSVLIPVGEIMVGRPDDHRGGRVPTLEELIPALAPLFLSAYTIRERGICDYQARLLVMLARLSFPLSAGGHAPLRRFPSISRPQHSAALYWCLSPQVCKALLKCIYTGLRKATAINHKW